MTDAIRFGKWWWLCNALGEPVQGPYASEAEAIRAMEEELHHSARGV